MSQFSIRPQTIWMRSNVRMDFRVKNSMPTLDVTIDGKIYRATFGPSGDVFSIRMLPGHYVNGLPTSASSDK